MYIFLDHRNKKKITEVPHVILTYSADIITYYTSQVVPYRGINLIPTDNLHHITILTTSLYPCLAISRVILGLLVHISPLSESRLIPITIAIIVKHEKQKE